MIAIRTAFVLGLSLLAALVVIASPSVSAAPASIPATDTKRNTVAPPAAGFRLAQATGIDQRGPRRLGAVPSSVQVPSLQCLSTDEAEASLRERQLKLGKIHLRPSTACPNGGVVAQSPPRGTTVGIGTAVEVIIAATGGSTGRPSKPNARIEVPDVQGLTPAEAQSLLRREGLEIGRIQRESAPAPLGTIISQIPAPGSPASVGNRVNVTVAAEVRVPDLRRLSRADALERLGEFSLRLGRITEESSSEPSGSVIKQWPLPGVPAAANDQVDITLAKGQIVPDLRALDLNDARAKLRQAGLQAGKVEQRISDQKRGTVIEQRPASGTTVQPGSSVNIILAKTPIVPDLAGRTLDQSKRLLADNRLRIGSITSKVSPNAQGTVLEQQPKANAEARTGTKVDLVLAKGLETPKLVGLTLDEAGAALAKQLMRLGKIERQVTAEGDNRITRQTPAAGASASLGVAIDVVVQVPPIVPDLVGLKEDAVTARLAEQRLALSDISYQLAPGTLDQTVIHQEPAPGTKISNGQTVDIVLAVTAAPTGRPDLVAVPTLVNLTVAQADQNLKSAGLLLTLDGTPSENRPHRITTHIPGPGRFTKVGTQVTAFVEPIDKVIVPDLNGVNQEIVTTLLTDNFLAEGERTWKLSTKRQGTVVDQDPQAGTEVAFGNSVNVVLSASSLIPDLTGLTPEEASPILGGQSMQLGGIEEVFSLRWPGTIVAQIPPPDSPTGGQGVVKVQVVGLVGPLTAGGSLLVALAGAVWFRTRRAGAGAPSQSMQPPPVYGIAKSAAARPAFSRTARAAARPEMQTSSEPSYVVEADTGNQVIQTDAPNLVKPSIRLRGRVDPGEQSLAVQSS